MGARLILILGVFAPVNADDHGKDDLSRYF